MRRKELEITNPAEIDAIIGACDCFRVAFADGTRPYILPLSFGYCREGGAPVFYFHGAAQGRKVDLVRKLGYLGFELDTDRQVHENEKACDFSVGYRSIIGEGEVTELTDLAEKKAALQIIMEKYSGKKDWEMPEGVLERTFVAKVLVKEMRAKAHS